MQNAFLRIAQQLSLRRRAKDITQSLETYLEGKKNGIEE